MLLDIWLTETLGTALSLIEVETEGITIKMHGSISLMKTDEWQEYHAIASGLYKKLVVRGLDGPL
jgi:hypothetical protein